MADDTITVINNENPTINLEIESFSTDVDVSISQSNEAALVVHDHALNAHANIINPITGDIDSIYNEISTINTDLATKATSSDVTAQLATKANVTSTYTKTEVDTALATKINTSDTTVTKQGNIFNGVNQLVQLNSSGQLPALDGSLITNVNPTLEPYNMPTLANNATTPNTQIDFSAGFCWDMSTLVKITNTAMTKKLDATFVAGSGNGGLDTGTKAINSWYYCFAISKADGTADFLFSTSSTSPTMPSGYTNKRRIGAIRTDSSGNIIGFKQIRDNFWFLSSISDLNIATTPTTPTVYTMTVPPNMIGIHNMYAYNTSAGQAIHFLEPVWGDAWFAGASQVSGSVYSIVSLDRQIQVNASSQVEYYCSVATGGVVLNTLGFIDMRGVN